MNTLKLIEIVNKADKDYALALVPADTLKKFAELIVRECADIADLNDNGSSDEWDKCARGISRDIKLTFGVEE